VGRRIKHQAKEQIKNMQWKSCELWRGRASRKNARVFADCFVAVREGGKPTGIEICESSKSDEGVGNL